MGLFNDIKYAVGRTKKHLTFRKEKNKSVELTREVVKKSAVKRRIKNNYHEFKYVIMQKLTEDLTDTVEWVKVRPIDAQLPLYNELLNDEDFLRFYNADVINEFNDIVFSRTLGFSD